MKETFGAFIRKKRVERCISIRGLARAIGKSPVYVSSFEKGSRPAPAPEVLAKLAEILFLSKTETALMYDLAAQSKNTLSLAVDLLTYINENEFVHKSLRLAQKYEADEKDWQLFIETLYQKYL